MVNLFVRKQRLLLDVPREKLTRLLSYFGFLFVFPLLVVLVVGSLEESATIGIKTFLPIELGMAVLSPFSCSRPAKGSHTATKQDDLFGKVLLFSGASHWGLSRVGHRS
jgi:hypothetical protein